MTCCDAMRKTISDWIGPATDTTLPHPMKYVWPDELDGKVRCHLCGAEWGPVKVADETAERAKE